MAPQLIPPTTAVRESFLQAAADLRGEGWLPHFPLEQASADFASYVAAERAVTLAWDVPTTVLWYVDAETYLGTAVIRHQLTEALRLLGGNLGYHVAPRQRRRGHATRMVGEALGVCADLGMAQVLITCRVDNVPSRRVIEANGGLLAEVADGECHYWVTTHPSGQPG